MLQPIGDHQLLVFLIGLLALLAVARLLGELARSFGQPSVVGELGAGILLGPSVFGRLLPDAADWVFPGGEVESALLLAVAQVGVILLLTITGFETDLQMLRRLGRPSLATAGTSLLLPLAAGFAVAVAMPARFSGEGTSPVLFGLFVAVAVSISALAVSGRILTEMDLMRRDIGQIIVGVAMANELVGWVLLGLLTGIVLQGGLNISDLVVTVLLVAAFFAVALTIGQRGVDAALRGARGRSTGVAAPFTVTVLVAFAGATGTQLIGVEAALGAFVAGIVLGRSRYQRADVVHAVEVPTMTVFAPVFFATAGMFVDVGAIADPAGLLWFAILLAAATVAKFAGAYVGARAGRLDPSSAVAMGVGLNARGTLEIVLATIALSLGTFNAESYTIVVLVAMVSAIVTPPLLRAALRRVTPAPEEAARLEREEVLAASVIANVENALVPTRGGENSRLAAETLDLVLKPEAAVTVLTVHAPDHPEVDCVCEEALASATAAFDGRAVERRRAVADEPSSAVLREAGLGYGLIALGMTEGFRDSHELSPTLGALLSRSSVPLLLVRHGTDGQQRPRDYGRVVVPATGTRVGRAAEEVAYTLGVRVGADVEVVHIVPRTDRASTGRLRAAPTRFRAWGRPHTEPSPTVQGLLTQALERAERFGMRADGHTRIGVSPYEGIIEVADEEGAHAIVVGAQVRDLEGRPFLGHGTEYVLEHAHQTVIVVVFPAESSHAVG